MFIFFGWLFEWYWSDGVVWWGDVGYDVCLVDFEKGFVMNVCDNFSVVIEIDLVLLCCYFDCFGDGVCCLM